MMQCWLANPLPGISPTDLRTMQELFGHDDEPTNMTQSQADKACLLCGETDLVRLWPDASHLTETSLDLLGRSAAPKIVVHCPVMTRPDWLPIST